MEIKSIKLINKSKEHKHICIKTKNNNIDYYIYLYDGRLVMPSLNDEDYEQVKRIACECFYWLLNNNTDIEQHTWTYETWKEYIQDRMTKYEQFDTQEHADMAIKSFYTYKKYLK